MEDDEISFRMNINFTPKLTGSKNNEPQKLLTTKRKALISTIIFDPMGGICCTTKLLMMMMRQVIEYYSPFTLTWRETTSQNSHYYRAILKALPATIKFVQFEVVREGE